MPKYHTGIQQGELAWYQLRLGKVTASELSNLVAPKFEIRTGEMPKSYLYQKLAEKLSGSPAEGFSTFATEQGQMLEDEARKMIAFEVGIKLRNVGFVTTDDDRAGCSPDALIGDDGGLEIKCPQPKNHMRYLVEGVLPADYAAQVHGSMYVTGRKYWMFASYSRKLPPFILRIERDEAICAKIELAIAEFCARLEGLSQKLGGKDANE